MMAAGPPLLQLPGGQVQPDRGLHVFSSPPGVGQSSHGHAVLMPLTNFKVLANMQGKSACVTVLLPNGPQVHLPNEFVASVVHATRGLPVTEMIIKHHQLESLPINFNRLHSITFLDLSCNRLGGVPGVITELQELRELHLEHNRISLITEPLGEKLPHLKVLQLQHNKLSELPAPICRSTSLQVLNINNNNIQVFSEELGKMTSLKELHAANNILEFLPISISKLVNLEELHLSNNSIHHIQDISSMTSLKQLHLANNLLQFLPPCFASMHQLQGLTLVGNTMRFPPLSACRKGVRHMQQYMLDHMTNCVTDYGPGQGGDAIITNLYYTGSDYELETGNQSPFEDID